MDTSSFIYLIRSDDNLYKIGRTFDPVKRLKQLQTGSGKKLSLVYTLSVKNGVAAERHIHAIFSGQRIQGEWFRFTDNDMILVKKIFKQLQVNAVEQKKLERMGLH